MPRSRSISRLTSSTVAALADPGASSPPMHSYLMACNSASSSAILLSLSAQSSSKRSISYAASC